MKGEFGETTIKVRRLELLQRIEANRTTHREVFEKALEAYKRAVTEWFEKRFEEIRNGQDYFDTAFRGMVPQDHTADYDRVIDMLKMEVRQELTIDEQQFRMYVRDDWGWKREFTITNSSYGV